MYIKCTYIYIKYILYTWNICMIPLTLVGIDQCCRTCSTRQQIPQWLEVHSWYTRKFYFLTYYIISKSVIFPVLYQMNTSHFYWLLCFLRVIQSKGRILVHNVFTAHSCKRSTIKFDKILYFFAYKTKHNLETSKENKLEITMVVLQPESVIPSGKQRIGQAFTYTQPV